MLWGFPPKQVDDHWENTCKCCFYCRRNVRSNYEPKFSIKGVKKLIENLDEGKKFTSLRTHCVDVIREAQDPEIYIAWQPVRQRLQHEMSHDTVWERPSDLYIPIADYREEHGDPETNGKGHKRGKNLDGQDCVLVPESNIMKRRRETRDSIKLVRVLDEGNDELGKQTLVNKFQSMEGACLMTGAGIDGAASASASGQTLTDLLGVSFLQGPGVQMSSSGDGGRKRSIEAVADNAVQAVDDSGEDDDAFVPVLIEEPAASRAHGTNLGSNIGNSNSLGSVSKKPKVKSGGISPGSSGSKVQSPGQKPPTTATGLHQQPQGAQETSAKTKQAKGRPRRDLSGLVRQTISSFEECPLQAQNADYRLWFGDQYETQAKFIARLKKDYEEWLATVHDEAELDKHVVDRKKLWAIKDIHTHFKKYGGELSAAFTKASDVVISSLNMLPVAELKMPVPVRRLYLEGKLQTAPIDEFWTLLANDNLSDAGFTDVLEQQQEKAADAVASLTQTPDCKAGLKELTEKLLESEDAERVYQNTKKQILAVLHLVIIFSVCLGLRLCQLPKNNIIIAVARTILRCFGARWQIIIYVRCLGARVVLRCFGAREKINDRL